jgi:hypothetical protein
MTIGWKQWIALAGLLVASASAFPQKSDSLVVDGNDWMSATPSERRAFLVGAANMIIGEAAYAKRNNLEVPPVSAKITKATAQMKLGDIEAQITRWYQANPDKLSQPVMYVVWQGIVKQ